MGALTKCSRDVKNLLVEETAIKFPRTTLFHELVTLLVCLLIGWLVFPFVCLFGLFVVRFVCLFFVWFCLFVFCWLFGLFICLFGLLFVFLFVGW